MKRKTKGLVLGKFMPLHQGHVLLLQFASQFVDELIVVVDKVADEPIPGAIRKHWIQALFPHSKIICLNEETPQTPAQHPAFWQYWRHLLNEELGINPDYLFASEDYGSPLSDVLGAKYIPFDPKRTLCKISATELKSNLYEKWHYLASSTQKDFLLKISLFGPESTGKSTLASQLAAHYQTVWVPEYARTLIETTGDIRKEEMLLVAKGQKSLEESLMPSANKMLICDTDPLLTTVWHQTLYNEECHEIRDIASQCQYDLTLVTDIDLEWVEDKARYLPDNREDFLKNCLKALQKDNRQYALVSGKGESRLQNALSIIDELLLQGFSRYKFVL